MTFALKVRETTLTVPDDPHISIQRLFHDVIKDDQRNSVIVDDVVAALDRWRQCLVLTQRKEHCRLLSERLNRLGKAPLILSGEVGKRQRTTIIETIQNAPSDKEMLVIATGEYLGEGFDCPRIDTLFLAFPISFKGKIVQYVGRALRSYPGKSSVEVYDYCDTQVLVLTKMYNRRLKTYKSLGFDIRDDKEGNRLI